MGKIAEKRLF